MWNEHRILEYILERIYKALFFSIIFYPDRHSCNTIKNVYIIDFSILLYFIPYTVYFSRKNLTQNKYLCIQTEIYLSSDFSYKSKVANQPWLSAVPLDAIFFFDTQKFEKIYIFFFLFAHVDYLVFSSDLKFPWLETGIR